MKEKKPFKSKATKKIKQLIVADVQPTPTPSLTLGVVLATPSPTNNLDPISTFEKVNISNIIADCLKEYKQELDEHKKVTYKEMNHLNLFAQEYLSSYAIIGFTLNDEKVCIINMPTPKDEGALVDLLRSTFIDIANNRG